MSAADMRAMDLQTVLGALRVGVTRITSDSRRVDRGDAFAAYPGTRADGRSYIPDAIARGAGSVLWDPAGFCWNEGWHVPQVAVEALKQRLGAIADEVYGHPSRKLWTVGVTGTNGKTSCALWIAQGLEAAGRRSGVLGTLGNGLLGELVATSNTTPDAASLHEMLAAMKAGGARCAVLEVSSHGLDQGRVNGVRFAVALFTNLTRDHLDYHGTMEAYGAAKARLFAWPGLETAVVNADDPFGATLAGAARARGVGLLSYGFGRGVDIAGRGLEHSARGVRFDASTPWGEVRLDTRLLGTFNASNVLGVLGVLLASGVALDTAAEFLGRAEPPPGRMQRFGGGELALVVVDYAHTPDALEHALCALRPAVRPGGSLVCVFGCGGDRDRGKRPAMGRVAAMRADHVIVTSDNPRGEEPAAIARDIVQGMPAAGAARSIELDRAAAIGMAIATAERGDVVLVAGKGHEAYQESNDGRRPFSDAAQVTAALARRGAQ